LPAAERERLFAACDAALVEIAAAIEPRAVVGVGGFAERRAREVLGARGIPISTILHPSPASPKANKNWAALVDAQLLEAGITLP